MSCGLFLVKIRRWIAVEAHLDFRAEPLVMAGFGFAKLVQRRDEMRCNSRVFRLYDDFGTGSHMSHDRCKVANGFSFRDVKDRHELSYLAFSV